MARRKEKVQGTEAGRENTRVKKVAHKRRRPRAGRRLRQDEALGKKGSQIKEEARVKEEVKFKKDAWDKEEAKVGRWQEGRRRPKARRHKSLGGDPRKEEAKGREEAQKR